MNEYAQMLEKTLAEAASTEVGAVFGESRQIGERVLIPVGKISYGSGGGAGQGTQNDDQTGEGGGMGLGVSVKPVGYIDATPERVTYRPIIDINMILAIGAGLAGLAALKLIRRK